MSFVSGAAGVDTSVAISGEETTLNICYQAATRNITLFVWYPGSSV